VILLVEDDHEIMKVNEEMFKREGYRVACALTLADARRFMSESYPEVVVIDIKLPDGSGLDFAKEIRQSEKSATPILFLTGLGTHNDVVRGLKAGGDDYMTKPYNFNELFARVEAVKRRYVSLPETINKGGLSIDVTAGIAMCGGKDLLLAKKEFAVLLIFIQNEERFITSDYIYERAWGTPMENDSIALNSAIKRLRKKIEGCGWSIGWRRGEGYIFEKS